MSEQNSRSNRRRPRVIPWKVITHSESLLRPVLNALLPPPQRYSRQLRTEMILLVLRIQAVHGRCFASAAYIAGATGGNEKTWDRLLAWMRDQGWAHTTRNVRADGCLSTNTIDLRGLWYSLVRRLGGALFDLARRIHQIYAGRHHLVLKISAGQRYYELVLYRLGHGPPRDTSPAAAATGQEA